MCLSKKIQYPGEKEQDRTTRLTDTTVIYSDNPVGSFKKLWELMCLAWLKVTQYTKVDGNWGRTCLAHMKSSLAAPTKQSRAGEMAQGVETFTTKAWRPDFNSPNPQRDKIEQTPPSCPLTSTYTWGTFTPLIITIMKIVPGPRIKFILSQR